MGHAVSFFCLFFSAAGGRVALSLGLAGAWDRDVSRCTLRAVPGLASSGMILRGAPSGDRALGVAVRCGDGSCTAAVPRGLLMLWGALGAGAGTNMDRRCRDGFLASGGEACGSKEIVKRKRGNVSTGRGIHGRGAGG